MKLYKHIVCTLAALVLFNTQVFAKKTVTQLPKPKYPDYAYEFVGRDKFEGFNRKMFVFKKNLTNMR